MPFRKARVVWSARTRSIGYRFMLVTYLQYRDESPLENRAISMPPTGKNSRPRQPYLILDTPSMGSPDKPGHYVGVVLNTEGAHKKSGFYFLEGNTKIWVEASLSRAWNIPGWGLLQGAWYYTKTRHRSKTEFSAPYHGLTVKTLTRSGLVGSMLWSKTKPMRLSQYRFHPEGIPFKESIHITVHHGEFDEIASNFSSVAYWYQNHS
jgi:hypothetical protein